MTASDFDEKFANYRTYLREEVHRFCDYVDIFQSIHNHKVDRLDELNLAPAFFQITENALFNGIIIWADKLFDENGERGLFNFLVFVENGLRWLSVEELKRRSPELQCDHWLFDGRTKVDLNLIKKHRNDIRGLNGVKAFRLRRNKYHAHFDKKYFFDPEQLGSDAPIEWADLRNAATLMGDIINDYSIAFDGSCFDWKVLNIDDLQVLLDRASPQVGQDSSAQHL